VPENLFSPPLSRVAQSHYVDGTRLEYELRFFDLVRFYITHQFLTPPTQTAFLVTTFFFCLGAAADRKTSAALFVAVLLYRAFWGIQAVYITLQLISRKNRSQLTTHVIEVSERSLFEETKFQQSHYFWPGVAKVVSRPGFVAIHVAQHMARIVPDRAFASQQQRESFVAKVKEKINAAAIMLMDFPSRE
jgi:hypothetical protein